MLPREIKSHLEITAATPLAGGDINDVYRVETAAGPQVLKLNRADRFPEMFAREADGLAALRATGTFVVPRVLARGRSGHNAYLLLEYLLPAPAGDYADFGRQLAALHRFTHPTFGFTDWNYIGSLQQPNGHADDAATFYVKQRLEPQFRLAATKGYAFPGTERLYRACVDLIPKEPPALLHGDLWSGNHLSTVRGFALVDPAVSYGPREMDLALMQLFGGYPEVAFRAYAEAFPLTPGAAERTELWQLYYLLVHVNLFGGGYVGAVRRVMGRYGGY